jgi:hypothetical protein
MANGWRGSAPCKLTRRVTIRAGALEAAAAGARDGGFDPIVSVNGKEVFFKHAWSRCANASRPSIHACVDLTTPAKRSRSSW